MASLDFAFLYLFLILVFHSLYCRYFFFKFLIFLVTFCVSFKTYCVYVKMPARRNTLGQAGRLVMVEDIPSQWTWEKVKESFADVISSFFYIIFKYFMHWNWFIGWNFVPDILPSNYAHSKYLISDSRLVELNTST